MNRRQAIWLLISPVLIAACITYGIQLGWQATGIIIVAAIAPDVALIGAFAGEGRLRPERVKFYNALHSLVLAIPVGMAGVIVALFIQSFVLLLIGLGWCTHIAVDRACGYRLREPDGSIRPVRASQVAAA